MNSQTAEQKPVHQRPGTSGVMLRQNMLTTGQNQNTMSMSGYGHQQSQGVRGKDAGGRVTLNKQPIVQHSQGGGLHIMSSNQAKQVNNFMVGGQG